MNKIIILYGPTAVGKSAIAIQLAKLLNGEIISADSMQIYKNLNIGTAKITVEEMKGIKHHLIDIKDPTEDYSVNDFCHDAKIIIDEILTRNKTPIIVGGTGLYIKSLINGYTFGNTEKNDDFRNSLKKFSNEELYNKLLEFNPNLIIDKQNRHRLIRKLECFTFGTECFNNNFDYDYALFAICDNREDIYKRINSRVDKMINDGLIDEVKYVNSICNENSLAMKAIGYKEFIPYLNNEKTLNECAEILKQKTRNYAKRQFTFMNQFNDIIKINFIGINETAEKIKEIIEEKNG